MSDDIRSLGELAREAASLPEYRTRVLQWLAPRLAFDAALFHELSPRVPLDRAASIALDLSALAAGRGQWDDNAVVLGRLRELALAQGGVASSDAAFPVASRARKAWETRVAKPLGIRAALVAHLTLRERIISAVLLFRKRSGFRAREQQFLSELVPWLSIGDALHQALHDAHAPSGPPVRLRCVDQRLSPRQRELVEHVALGHTNREIGVALGLSENTVRNLLTEARRRVGAGNRAELVRVAVLR